MSDVNFKEYLMRVYSGFICNNISILTCSCFSGKLTCNERPKFYDEKVHCHCDIHVLPGN